MSPTDLEDLKGGGMCLDFAWGRLSSVPEAVEALLESGLTGTLSFCFLLSSSRLILFALLIFYEILF